MTTRALSIAVMFVLIAGAAGAQLTSEVPLSTPEYGPAPGSSPIVASDGADFLVAWARGGSIYANRVSRNGETLDGTGIRVPLEAGLYNLRLIGLFPIEGAYTLIYSYNDIQGLGRTAAVSVSSEGKILSGPRVILDGAYVRAGASNGSRIVLLSGLDLVVVNGRGDLLDRFPSLAVPAYAASIASNGSTFLVVTYAYDGFSNSVNLIALDASGRTGRITRVDTGGSGNGPTIVSDGTDYLVLFKDPRTGKMVAWSVTASGEVPSASTLEISPSYAAMQASLQWTGQHYLLATPTSGSGQIGVMTLDRKVLVAGTARVLGPGTPGQVNSPAMAWNGSEVLVVWGSGSSTSRNGIEIEGELLSEDGTARSAMLPISISSNVQVSPLIGTGGAHDLAVWSEPSGIFATRVDSAGAGLDGRGILIYAQSAEPSLIANGAPLMRLLFDGSAYLVAWAAYPGVRGQRIDAQTGSLLGAPILLATCARSFDVAKDADSAVIFAVGCSDEHQLYAQRLGVTGAVGPAISISPSGMFTDAPRAAWNGHQWLVAWNHLITRVTQFQFPTYNADVYAARLTGALTLLDTKPIALAVSSSSEISPLVASDGHDFLVAWSRLSYDETAGLYFRRVLDEGSTGAILPIVKGPYQADALVWGRAQYVLAYESTWASSNHDLFLSHIPAHEDQTSAMDQVPFSLTELDERAASLAAIANGRIRLVYQRVAPEAQYGGVSRVFLRDEISVLRRRPARGR